MLNWRNETFMRIGVGFLCLILVATGVAFLLRGEFLYPNYSGDAVFPGLAVLVGLAGLAAVFFFPMGTNRRHRSRKDAKARRRLTRKKEAKTRFPWNDYQKW